LKHLARLLLLVAALAAGGRLGSELLPGFAPVKMIVFAAACVILGEVFYQVDKRISKWND